VKAEQPLIAHDLTEVRTRVLAQHAHPVGEGAYVTQLMKEFLNARSDISPFLYKDTLPCLRYLQQQQQLRISVLTDGNALNTCLQDFTTFFLTAADIGANKPSPVGFIACALLLNIPTHRILYIGKCCLML
jgi:FMN phosphatase YigB (HAD superfamily)